MRLERFIPFTLVRLIGLGRSRENGVLATLDLYE
jgi:hypothetical protein